MKMLNTREGQGGFESKVVGEEPVIETGGAAREVGTAACVRADYVKAKRRKNFAKKQVVRNYHRGEEGAWSVRVGVGLQMWLYRSI